MKNVDAIELGRFIMDTWYFSPLPPEYNNSKARGFPVASMGCMRTQWAQLLRLCSACMQVLLRTRPSQAHIACTHASDV